MSNRCLKMGYFAFVVANRGKRGLYATGNMARARRKQASFSNISFLIVSIVFIEFEFIGAKNGIYYSNDGDVVIVDHDLENEELKLLIRQRNQQEKPEDYI